MTRKLTKEKVHRSRDVRGCSAMESDMSNVATIPAIAAHEALYLHRFLDDIFADAKVEDAGSNLPNRVLIKSILKKRSVEGCENSVEIPAKKEPASA